MNDTTHEGRHATAIDLRRRRRPLVASPARARLEGIPWGLMDRRMARLAAGRFICAGTIYHIHLSALRSGQTGASRVKHFNVPGRAGTRRRVPDQQAFTRNTLIADWFVCRICPCAPLRRGTASKGTADGRRLVFEECEYDDGADHLAVADGGAQTSAGSSCSMCLRQRLRPRRRARQTVNSAGRRELRAPRTAWSSRMPPPGSKRQRPVACAQ